MISENKIQQQIVQWFRNNHCLRHNSQRCCIFSVPNERGNIRELQRMKATGLMAGVSDLVVIFPNNIIFVEVKDATGRQQPKQREFEGIVQSLGFDYFLVRSLEEFKDVVKNYIKAD